MPGHIRVGGVWKTITPKFKVGGVWKTATGGWVKVAGTWRKWYPPTTPASAIVLLGDVYSTAAGNKQLTSLTPQNGSRLVAFVALSGSNISTATVGDTNGGTWTLIGSASYSTTLSIGIFLLSGAVNNVTTTYVMAPNNGANTGGSLTILEIRGASGLTYVNGGQLTGTVGTMVPTVTVPAPAIDLNSVVVAFCCCTTSVGTSLPGDFTEHTRNGWSTPLTVFTVSSKISGQASNTLTWISSVATPSAIVCELRP